MTSPMRLQTPHPVMQLAGFRVELFPKKMPIHIPLNQNFPWNPRLLMTFGAPEEDASPNASQAEDQVLIRGAKFQGDCTQNSMIDCIKWGNIGHDIVVITSKLN